MARRTPLIIPSEVQTREFDAKLLLACLAAERGFASIVGCRTDIHLNVAALPRSIYVAKDVRYSSRRMFDILQRLGHAIVALDEEAPFYYSRAYYLQSRVSEPVLRRTRALFAWGPENAEAWRGCAYYHGAPIHVTGNPRVDLMRPELRPFFAAEAERIRARFGRFILVNSNFGSLNHYFPNLTTLLPPDLTAGTPAAPDKAFDAGLAAHRHAIFRSFLEIVPRLARTFPDHAVVVRPHPAENHETWREAGGGLPNLHVVHEGSVIPWLMTATAMIHNSCTTGLEGYVVGAPVIAYRPATSERFDLALPNSLSHEVFDAAALIDAVGRAVAGALPCDAETARARRRLAARHVAALDGPLASEAMVDVLDRFEAAGGGRKPPVRSRVAGYLSAELRRRGKERHAETPGHKSNIAYTRHRFPGVVLPEVEERIGRFRAILGRFEAVRARQTMKNVFKIAAS